MGGEPSASRPYYAGVVWDSDYSVSRVVVYWNSETSMASLNGYTLEYSTDGGESYRDSGTFAVRSGTVDTFEFDPSLTVNAVRVKITGKAEGATDNLSIREFEVFGTETSSPHMGVESVYTWAIVLAAAGIVLIMIIPKKYGINN